METNDLEREISNLAGETRKEILTESVVPSTLDILQSGRYHYSSLPAKKAWRGEVRQSRIPILATLFLLFVFIPFFSFNSEPALTVVRLILLFFSIVMGTTLFFKPGTMAEIDRKMLGSRLSRIGPVATGSQEILLFRVQALYFILIAVFICRL